MKADSESAMIVCFSHHRAATFLRGRIWTNGNGKREYWSVWVGCYVRVVGVASWNNGFWS